MKKIDEMVNRFLAWPMPQDFHPDCGISFKKIDHPTSWPIGTNLLNADQAKAMILHILGEPLTIAQCRELTQEKLGVEMSGDDLQLIRAVELAHGIDTN